VARVLEAQNNTNDSIVIFIASGRNIRAMKTAIAATGKALPYKTSLTSL
jgi:hypothetical protein